MYLVGSLFLSTVIIISAVVIFWDSEEQSISNIKDINLEVIDKKIRLSVSLNKPMTCKEVIRELELDGIILDKKHHKPVCIIINDMSIKIYYEEDKSI